jgi:hypothetical protein
MNRLCLAADRARCTHRLGEVLQVRTADHALFCMFRWYHGPIYTTAGAQIPDRR